MAWNYCPNCGHRVYQHGNTGGCEHETQVHHIARVQTAGVTIKHPLAEREQDKLFDCRVLEQVLEAWFPRGEPEPGEYALVDNGNGGWSYEPPERATETCPCNVSHESLTDRRVAPCRT